MCVDPGWLASEGNEEVTQEQLERNARIARGRLFSKHVRYQLEMRELLADYQEKKIPRPAIDPGDYD